MAFRIRRFCIHCRSGLGRVEYQLPVFCLCRREVFKACRCLRGARGRRIGHHAVRLFPGSTQSGYRMACPQFAQSSSDCDQFMRAFSYASVCFEDVLAALLLLLTTMSGNFVDDGHSNGSLQNRHGNPVYHDTGVGCTWEYPLVQFVSSLECLLQVWHAIFQQYFAPAGVIYSWVHEFCPCVSEN